jgi:hypothetical protein
MIECESVFWFSIGFLSGSLAILTIFIWKLIRHEAGPDRPLPLEKNFVLVYYPSMTDDKTELRASLRLAITTIRKLKANQKVDTKEVLRILNRTLQQEYEAKTSRRVLRVRL